MGREPIIGLLMQMVPADTETVEVVAKSEALPEAGVMVNVTGVPGPLPTADIV